MKFCILFATIQFLHVAAFTQYNKHIVELADKKGTTHTLANPSSYLSAKAIARRARQNIAIDSTDLPVSAAYLDSIGKVPNVTVIHVSKWLNQVLVQTNDINALNKINSFPFVKKTYEIAPAAKPSAQEPVMKKI